MSYEGYEQYLCANGHSWERNGDSYWTEYANYTACPYCQAKCVWWNAVDITNGSFDIDENGNETSVRIDGYVELEVLNEPAVCECKCGHKHPFAGTQTTYKLPLQNVGHHIK